MTNQNGKLKTNLFEFEEELTDEQLQSVVGGADIGPIRLFDNFDIVDLQKASVNNVLSGNSVTVL